MQWQRRRCRQRECERGGAAAGRRWWLPVPTHGSGSTQLANLQVYLHAGAPSPPCSLDEDAAADVERLRNSWADLIEQTEGWLDYRPPPEGGMQGVIAQARALSCDGGRQQRFGGRCRRTGHLFESRGEQQTQRCFAFLCLQVKAVQEARLKPSQIPRGLSSLRASRQGSLASSQARHAALARCWWP